MEFKRKTLKEFIDTYKSFNVPYYQRNYVWAKKENESILVKFVNDIIKAFESGKESKYYIGNLAICSRSVTDIVDGQQRLTTIILMLTTILNGLVSSTMKTKLLNILKTTEEKFIIEDAFDLKGNILSLINNDMSVTKTTEIHNANKIIHNILDKKFETYNTEKFDRLAEFLIENIDLTFIQFNNSNEAFQYFLNINTFSAPLSEMDIFYASLENIIISLGLNQNVKDNYVKVIQAIDADAKWLSEEDIIDIYLRTYFKNDLQLNTLGRGSKLKKGHLIGVGKWFVINKSELYEKAAAGKDFIDTFQQFLIDIKEMISCFNNTNPNTNKGSYKNIYTTYLLCSLYNYEFGYDIMLNLFKNRNDYKATNIYKNGSKSIDYSKVDTFCRLFNATVIANVVNCAPLIQNLDINTEKGKNLSPIIKNIAYSNVFKYNYYVDKKDLVGANTSLDNVNKNNIKLLLALQEAFLQIKLSNQYTMNDIIFELIKPEFNIEHLISLNEYKREARRKNWNARGKFLRDFDFDNERNAFENLTLISGSINSSMKDTELGNKLKAYEKAANIKSTSEPEYLCKTYNTNSSIYSNTRFLLLGLPNRGVTLHADGNTWEHDPYNKEFTNMLLQLAVTEILL